MILSNLINYISKINRTPIAWKICTSERISFINSVKFQYKRNAEDLPIFRLFGISIVLPIAGTRVSFTYIGIPLDTNFIKINSPWKFEFFTQFLSSSKTGHCIHLENSSIFLQRIFAFWRETTLPVIRAPCKLIYSISHHSHDVLPALRWPSDVYRCALPSGCLCRYDKFSRAAVLEYRIVVHARLRF